MTRDIDRDRQPSILRDLLAPTNGAKPESGR